jgi:hypothetical protein
MESGDKLHAPSSQFHALAALTRRKSTPSLHLEKGWDDLTVYLDDIEKRKAFYCSWKSNLGSPLAQTIYWSLN